ncbi:MAG: CNNM domain-containing protein [Planctomycetota bacterium]
MTTPEIVFWIALAVFGTIDSALWSGLETATYVVSRLRLESRLADPETAKSARRLKNELDHPRRALATLLVMNNLSNYVGALALATLLTATGLSDWAVTLINVAVLTPVLFVFAETLPKEVFRTRAETFAYRFIPVLLVVRTALTIVGVVPLVLLVTGAAERLFGGKPIETDDTERVRALLQEAAGAGILSDEQSTLLNRAAAFGTTTAADEMVPWAKVRKLRDDTPIAAAAKFAADSGFARLPLTDRRGVPVGVVETLALLRNASDPSVSPRDLASAATRIESQLTASAALAELQRAPSPLGIVYHQQSPLGIVTVKDLVEPLTGDLSAW